MELTNDSLRSGSRSRRRKILIAEDSEINRGILRELLRCEYDIMEAADGNEAYAILKNKYRELSAVILDLVMPQCDGYQFMEMVRDDPLLSTVPIIVLTGGHSKNKEEYCLKCGASDFLTKPFSPSLIRARLQNIIRMREMTSSLNAIEFDDLTGIYTKQAFFYHARTML
ncbi:MAG: response regulator, partial [Firmicutes bacterium]|nr:response regulator [Bacillota bacterium]